MVSGEHERALKTRKQPLHARAGRNNRVVTRSSSLPFYPFLLRPSVFCLLLVSLPQSPLRLPAGSCVSSGESSS